MEKPNTPYTLPLYRRARSKNGGVLHQMKIDLTLGKFRILRGTMLLIAVVLLAYVAYAATTLSISNSGSVTISTGANLLASLSKTSTTVCDASQGPYSDSGLAITTWSVPVGGSQTLYACVWNNGPAHTLSISGAGFPSGLTFTSTGGVAVLAGGYQLVSFTLTASSSAAVAPFSGATITIA
jgi:hypothetical protein